MNIKNKFKEVKTSRIIIWIIIVIFLLIMIFMRFFKCCQIDEKTFASQISLGFEYNLDLFPICILGICEALMFIFRKKAFYILSLVFCLISFLMYLFFAIFSNYIVGFLVLTGFVYLINLILIIVINDNKTENV